MLLKTRFSRKNGSRMVPVNSLMPFAMGGNLPVPITGESPTLQKPQLSPINTSDLVRKSIAAREEKETDAWGNPLPPGAFELESLNPEQIQEFVNNQNFSSIKQDPVEVENFVNLLNKYRENLRKGGKVKKCGGKIKMMKR